MAVWACAPLVLLGTASPWLVLYLPHATGHLARRHAPPPCASTTAGVAARRRLPPPPARPNRPPPDVVCFSMKPSACIKGAEPSPRARNLPSAHYCRRRARARRGPAASDPHCPSEPRHHLPRRPLTLLGPNPLPHRRRSAAAPDQSHRRPPLSADPPPPALSRRAKIIQR